MQINQMVVRHHKKDRFLTGWPWPAFLQTFSPIPIARRQIRYPYYPAG